MIPNAILYQPKLSKLCLLTNAIKNLITNNDTKNAVNVPDISTMISVEFKLKPSSRNFATFKSDAPSITGIAKKNENSAAAVLDTLIVEAPKIVEPERDVPGIKESTWKHPILRAVG